MGPVCGSAFCTDAVKRPLLNDILEVLDFSEAGLSYQSFSSCVL